MNVGDPCGSSGEPEVLADKPNQRGSQDGRGEVSGVIVLTKRGNARGGKDPGQSRPLKGNVMRATEPQSLTDTKLKRIAWLSARDRHKQFDCLVHHFNDASLHECFDQLDAKKAVGVDGVTKANYAENLKANIDELAASMRRMAYRPSPVRRVEIPKDGKPGATRPLGISRTC